MIRDACERSKTARQGEHATAPRGDVALHEFTMPLRVIGLQPQQKVSFGAGDALRLGQIRAAILAASPTSVWKRPTACMAFVVHGNEKSKIDRFPPITESIIDYRGFR